MYNTIMPELPEVETIKRGITPFITQQRIVSCILRQQKLRWPIPSHLSSLLPGQVLQAIERRAKYLLLHCTQGTLLIHLGMSGRLRILQQNEMLLKHDHMDIAFENNILLRFNDARRFGAILWLEDSPYSHPLLNTIGPEPFAINFNGAYLWQRARNKRIAIKTFIMDGHIVAGVGNIYAAESLYLAGIHPLTPANKISLARFEHLACAIKTILTQAIEQGGTTLKDFMRSDGTPGFFKQALQVYGRAGLACNRCHKRLTSKPIANRATVYCIHCQKR
jgi:formamidopyrimidine-DNA glycosylase